MISFHSWITSKIKTPRSVKLQQSNFFWWLANFINFCLHWVVSSVEIKKSYHWPRLPMVMKLYIINIHNKGIWRKHIINKWKYMYRCSRICSINVEPHKIYWSISLPYSNIKQFKNSTFSNGILINTINKTKR